MFNSWQVKKLNGWWALCCGKKVYEWYETKHDALVAKQEVEEDNV